jgi:hypothetical protein
MAGFLPPNPPAAVVFMETAPTVEWVRGDLFRITMPEPGYVWIVEASVLAEGIAKAALCYREYRTAKSADIIRFPNRGDLAG